MGRLLLALIFSCAALLHGAAGQCTFATRTMYSRDQVLACFDVVPVTDAAKERTVETLKIMWPSYAFSARTQPPGISTPHWNISVDMPVELDALRARTDYRNAHDFHVAVADLYHQVRDNHLTYLSPACYEQFYAVHPWRFKQTLNGTTPVLWVAALPGELDWVGAAYATMFGSNPATNRIGRRVISMNGQDPVQFISAFADTQGGFKQAGARYNNALYIRFWLRSLIRSLPPMAITYVLDDGAGGTESIVVDYGFGVVKAKSANSDMETCAGGLGDCDDCDTFGILNVVTFYGFSPIDVANINTFPNIDCKKIVNYYTLKNPSTTAILKIATFFPGDKPEDTACFVNAARAGLKHAKDNGITDLILDMRYNPGGYNRIAGWLWHFLWPDTKYCPSVNYGYPQTTVNDAVASNGYHFPAVDLPGNEPTTPTECTLSSFAGNEWYTGNAKYPAETLDWGFGRTQKVSPMSHAPAASDANIDFCETLGKVWSPQHIMILTDATCGSACGIFTSQLEQHLVRTVVMGGFPDQPMRPYEFPGGTVNFYNIQRESAASNNLPSIPPPLDSTADYSYTSTFYAAVNPGSDVWLEFYYHARDFYIPLWEWQNLDALYGAANAFFGESFCASWEVLADPTCDNAVQASDPNAIGGRPCAGGVFNSATCVRAGCKAGFHLNSYSGPSIAVDGKCVATPNCPYLTPGAIAGIVVGVVVGAAIIVVAIFLVVRHLRAGGAASV